MKSSETVSVSLLPRYWLHLGVAPLADCRIAAHVLIHI